jgi:hypothetical protein
MSAVTKYLTVALVAVSLSACHTYRSHPIQLATPRPEDVLIQRSRPSVEHDTVGIGLFDKMVVVRSAYGTTLGTVSGWLMGAKWSKIKLYLWQRPLHPKNSICGRCPVRITKRR